MPLIQLNVSQLRNLHSISFKPIPQGFNYIYGDNGSGKTSLLEAIYYLSLGKSFRSTNNERIMQHAKTKFAIFGQVWLEDGVQIPLGLERCQEGGLLLRINGGNATSIAEFADVLPVQLIDSQCHTLLDGGPHFRRKYLDWGIFYAQRDFLTIWRSFERALKQRNAAIRGLISAKELEVWTNRLVDSASRLHIMRQEYVGKLMAFLEQFIQALLPMTGLKMHYYGGWDHTKNYHAILQQNREKDFQLGYTQSGPHRADFKIFINGVPARDILSRGQQKLFVCAMMLARGAMLQSYIKKPIYLVDDLPAELDLTSRSRLIDLLSRQEAQVFVTATEVKGFETSTPMKLFHVEHGSVKEIT
jgi:DNA replication and repair protein RecF